MSKFPPVSRMIPAGLLALLGILIMTTSLAAEDDLGSNPIRFAVIGDRTGSHVEGIYGQVVTEIARLRPEFAITVGDMIEGYTNDTAQMVAEWTEYLALLEPLDVPVYFTPGNHDITYDGMLPMYRRFIGKPYRSFNHRGLHVVVLDNSRWDVIAEFPAEQIAWLIEDLKQHADAQYTAVFFHQPYWYRTIADNKPDTLHNIFRTYGVDAVFTGHFHRYFTGEYDGIKYTCIGSSGGGADASPSGLLYHFAWVTVDTAGLHIAPIKMSAVLPWEEQTVGQLRTRYEIENRSFAFLKPAVFDENLHATDVAVTLQIKNMVNEECRDTIRWDIPDGWTVTPAEYPVTIPAGGTASASFTVSSPDKPYPVPRYSVTLPYDIGKTTTFDGNLEIVRDVPCTRATTPPAIDGDLSDNVWSTATSNLIGPEGDAPTIDPVDVYFAYDSDNLYYAVRCTETDMASIRAEMTEHDDPVYTEDCFGVMVHAKEGSGCQIYVNPLGTVYDQLLQEQTDGYWTGDNTWNGEYEIKTRRGDGFWTIEARVPLAQLGVEADTDDQWRVNFRRKQSRQNSFAAWQLPWTYDPQAFGRLVFK